MFGTVQIPKVAFGTHVQSLASAKKTLMAVESKFPAYKSQSSVLDLYKAQFEELSSLMKTYANFLEHDIERMRNAGDEIFLMDTTLGKALRPSTLN